MLSLQINGEYCDLGDDFSFTMNLKSPIFSSDTGSASYPFKIPNTERNARLMGFKHRPENTGNVYQTAQGTFLWDNKILFQGTLKMKILNSKSFEGALYEGSGDFNYCRKNMGIRDFEYYDYHFENEQEGADFATGCNDKYYPERHVAFPQIRDYKYISDTPGPDNQIWYINNQNNSGVITLLTDFYKNRTNIVPMVFLRSALFHIFTGLGYTILSDHDFFNDTDLNKLVIYNSLSCNGLCPDFTYNFTDIYAKMHLPKMSLNDFLKALENFFNIRFFMDYINKTVKIINIDEVISAASYIDFEKNIISLSTELETDFPGIMLSLKLDSGDSYCQTELDPESSLFDFLRPEVDYLSQLPSWPTCEINEIRYVKSLNAYYIVTPTTYPPSWIPSSLSFWSRKFFRSPDKQEELPLSSLYAPSFGTYSWVECGNALADWKDITLRLIFVRQYYNEHFMGGYHSTTNYNLWMKNENSSILNSVMDKWHKKTLEFKHTTRLVKITKQMDFMDFINFDFSRKYLIGGIKYLIKTIQVNLKKDQIMPALMECYIAN
jgi:hypothetical protein